MTVGTQRYNLADLKKGIPICRGGDVLIWYRPTPNTIRIIRPEITLLQYGQH